MNRAKIKTYIGFAVKAGKIIQGTDNLLIHKKKLYLVVIDEGLQPNALNKIISYAENRQVKMLKTENLSELTNIMNYKVIGITNKSLAEQIETNSSEE